MRYPAPKPTIGRWNIKGPDARLDVPTPPAGPPVASLQDLLARAETLLCWQAVVIDELRAQIAVLRVERDQARQIST